MWKELPRRKRQVVFAAAGGALFLSAVAVAASLRRPPREYLPGETVEGVTRDLARDLPPDYPRVAFHDVTRSAGIAFRHFSGTRTSQLPEDMGSGAAWGDYDGDGWPDLFVANEVGPLTMSPAGASRSPARCALYHNNRDGTFTEVALRAGIDHRGWAMAGAWADVDNDGDLDLVVTGYGHLALYRNDGNGTFAEEGRRARLAGPEGFWTGEAWGDYDRDGYPDLYVTGYVRYDTLVARASASRYDVENPAAINPSTFHGERNLLFHNDRDGTFTEVARRLGVTDPDGRSLSAVWADLDGNGWPDLYVANDVSDNVLYLNLGDGIFQDVSERAQVGDYRSAMGVATGDWNGDGTTDLFITHWLAQENALYDNQLAQTSSGAEPALTFRDEADRYGVGQVALDDVGWGTFFFDYDNDGRLDLFAVNGSTLQRRDAPRQLVPMSSRLFWNGGADAGFYETSRVGGAYFGRKYVGRGAAYADYDNDGDLDVFVVNNGGPGVLLRNDGPGRNHWLEVDLRGKRSNRFGLGAKLRLVAGGRAQRREVGADGSYLSQSALTAHFGLGRAGVIDTLEIDWPGGGRQRLVHLSADRRLVIEEEPAPSSGGAAEAPTSPSRRAR
ncbi:MAG TPA: CRTAC1 family protein [Longimicrobiaceae bacterium]|nr:CRTAC1 family protein [Longimicrobiaceae bacterium]